MELFYIRFFKHILQRVVMFFVSEISLSSFIVDTIVNNGFEYNFEYL
jgi:hypothetical protein